MSTNRTFNKVQLDVKFTQATTRANLISEENISISFGKISKYFADLHSQAFTGYTHPNSFTAKTTAGFYKYTVNTNGHVTAGAALAKSDITALGIPGSNTTYTFATGDAVGQFKVTPSGGTATNYSVNGIAAGTSSGTAKHLAYYDSATSITSTGNIVYSVQNSTASTPRSRTILNIFNSNTVGNDASALISGTKGVLSYGDGGPQINFSTTGTIGGAQDSAIIWTDNDSAAAGASWHFVSSQTDWNVISKRFHARTGISIGTDLPNTSYNLYVNGTTNITGATTIGGTLVLSKTQDASGTANNSPALIVGGTAAQAHLELDNNEIMAKTDGTSTAALYINTDGGNVYINNNLAARHTATPTSGQVVITDGTAGGIKSSGYTIAKSVPSNAVFTDHITTVTSSGSGNAVTAISADANGALTVTKGSTFSLSTHTHDSLYGVQSSSAVPVTTLANGQLKVFYNVNNGLSGNMPATNNANAIIQINKHGGNYDTQLGFSSNGNIYYRSCNGVVLSASVPWRRIYDTSNPPTASEVGALPDTTKYAGSSSAGGPANSSNVLNSNTRMDYGWNGVNYFNISGTAGNAAKVNDTPTTAWWHIMRFNHNNNAGYYTDLAIPFNATSLYYKRITAGSVQNGGWVKVLDVLNFESNAEHSESMSGVYNLTNQMTPIARSQNLHNRANKLALLPNANITVEYSTDAGSTWTSMGLGADELRNLFNDSVRASVPVGPNNSAERTTSMQTRITITSDGRDQCIDQYFLALNSSYQTISIDVQVAYGNATSTFSNLRTGISVTPWNYQCIINTASKRFGTNTSADYTNKIRFIIKYTSVNGSYKTAKATIISIAGYSGIYWGGVAKNNLMVLDHLYTWDNAQNATFPAKLNAIKYHGWYGQKTDDTRQSTANLTCTGKGAMQLIIVSSTLTTGRPAADGYIMDFDWDNTGQYKAQLYIPNTASANNGIQWRAQTNSSDWSAAACAWRTVLDNSNYTSYTVKKDGTGATGSWGISITGNATRADYVNVVASNEIRFYNDNQFKANNHFWLGYSWAAGSHYTPSGGSDTSSTTAPNITEFVMGNCSGGGLASVHAKTFILGNGSSPTKSSKTTTIATAATTTDRTITLPDDSGTVALTSKTFNVTRGSSVSTATAGYWAAMCNSTQTGSPVLPTSGKWWHVISMDWSGDDIKNWISQLAIATKDGSGVWWRRNDTSGTSIDSFSWHRLAEGNSSGAATNVATEVGSAAGARPVFYAYLGDNTRVVYNTNFTYNPSGNVLTATTFAGALSGNATSANKLNTNAGASNNPVYFSGGVPVACNVPASGSWFNGGIPEVRNGDGVMEIGKYIDFHATNTSEADYDYRIETSTTAMSLIATGSSNTLTIRSPGNAELSFQTTSSGKAYTAPGIICYPLTTSGMTSLFNFGGNLVIGGGESAKTLYDNNYDTIKTAEREDLYLCADNDIHIVTGCKTYADKSIIEIDALGKVYLPTSGGIIVKQRSDSNYVSATTWWKGGTAPESGEYAPQIGQHNTGGDSSYPGSICILPYKSTTNPWGGTVGLFIRKDHVYIDGVELSKSTHTHKYAGSSSAGGDATNANAANVTVTDVPSTSTSTDAWKTSYGILFAQNPNTTQSNTLRKSHNLRFYHGPNGTADTVGVGELIVGNSTASGTAGNMQGRLILYSSSSSYISMVPAATSSARTITLPAATGNVILGTKGSTSYYGLMDGNASTTNWIRATSNGFIPSASAKFFQTATSSLGTNSWYFNNSYIQNMTANRLVLGAAKTADGAAKGQLKFFSGNGSDATGTVTLECADDAVHTGDYTVKLPTWNGTIPVFEKLFEGASNTVSLSYSDIDEYDVFLITVANSNATSEPVTVTSLWISNVAGIHDMPLIWGGAPTSSGGSCNVTSGWIQLSKNSGTTTFVVAHKPNVAQMTSSGWTISSPTYNLYIRKIFGLKAFKRT